MLLEKTYKSDIEIYSYVRDSKQYIQNLSYYLAKDSNINTVISIMKKVAQLKDFDEDFRRQIIVNNYSNNIVYFKKILSVFVDMFNLKNTVLNDNSFEKILKCCRTFSDNNGKRLLKQFGLYKIVLLSVDIINLFNNGTFTEHDLEEIREKQFIVKSFFDNIYINEDLYLEYIENEIENIKERKNENDAVFKKSITSLINNMNTNMNIVYDNYDVVAIVTELSNIEVENDVLRDKISFLNEVSSLLSKKLFISINKKLINLCDNNTFIFGHFDTIIKSIIINKK